MSMPPDPGLCARCRHLQRQRSAKGSAFLRCGLADERDDLPRYPPLPVLACEGFERGAATGTAEDAEFG